MKVAGSLLITLFSALLLTPRAHAFPPANDFDGDGYSDMVLISIGSGNALTWKIVSGQTGTELGTQSNFGIAGNNIAIGRWLAKTHSSLGFVATDKNAIRWTVLGPASQTISKKFGKKSNTVVAGADFDGNGFTDAAVIARGSDGRLTWTIKRDLFTKSSAQIKVQIRKKKIRKKVASVSKTVFGSSGDIPFFADPNGSGDWAGILKSDHKNVYLRNVFTGSTKHFKLSNFTAGSMRPLALKQASGGDLLVFPKQEGGVTTLSFFTTTGASQGQAQVNSDGEVLVGNFLTATAEIAVQDDANFLVHNVASTQTETKAWGSGIAVDAVNITQFEDDSNPDATPTPGGGGGNHDHEDNPPPPAGTLNSICTNMHPMNRDVLYKVGSGGTNDSRTGKPVFLWYDCVDPGVERLYVLASNGQVIATFGLYPQLCQYVRFYSGYTGGSGYTGAQLMSLATAASGSKNLYFYTKNGNCWGPVPNANGRSGGR